MANFCGRCGSALVDGKCPNCNKNSQENIAVVPVTTEQTAPTPVIPATNNTPDKKAQRKAKKKAKWQALTKKQRTTRIILKVVAWFLAALVLVSVALSTLVYFDIVKIPFINSLLVKLGIKQNACNTNSTIAFSYADHIYYNQSGTLLDISDEDNPVIIDLDSGPDHDPCQINIYCAAFLDNAIYCRKRDEPDLYKYTINKDGSIEEEKWVKQSTLMDADIKFNDIPRTNALRSLTYLDDYFYFYYYSNVDFYQIEKDKAYRLGRISLDGEEVELLNDDIHTNAIATDGEWLYYFENGHNKNDTYNPDGDIIGIYRTKGDCEETELIYKMEPKECYYNSYEYRCSNLKVYDNYLYFLNCEDNIVAQLCRLNLDNNEVETVSTDSIANYTIDTENNMIYYSNGKFYETEPYTVCEMTIDGKNNRELFKFRTTSYSANSELLTVLDGYLYTCDPDRGLIYGSDEDSPYAVGYRYNIKEDDLYALLAYREMEMELNPTTGVFETKVEDPVIYWEKVDIKPDSVFSHTYN